MVTAEPVIPQNATAESRGNGVDGVAGAVTPVDVGMS